MIYLSDRFDTPYDTTVDDDPSDYVRQDKLPFQAAQIFYTRRDFQYTMPACDKTFNT